LTSLSGVRDSPRFAVIPAQPYERDRAFAQHVETLFLEYGVSVVRSPSRKKISSVDRKSQEQEKAIGPGESIAGATGRETTVTQTYFELEQNQATYYVETYERSGTVRIIEKSSNDLVAVFTASRFDRISAYCALASTLFRLGIEGTAYASRRQCNTQKSGSSR